MMKKIFCICFFLAGFWSFAQEHIRFETSPFQQILQKAKKENKIVFLDAFASWCGPCKLMEKNVFTDNTVGNYFNTNFINARIDMEKGEGREIAGRYQVGSYPTYLFLNGDGEVVFRGMGYMDSNNFIAMAKEANNPFNKKGNIKEQFEKGENDPSFLKNAVKMYANTDREFAKKASERYFQGKKDKAFSQEEISMLLYFLRSVNDPNYKVFQNSKDEITKVLPVNIYNQFDTQLKLGEISEKAINRQTMTLDEKYFLAEAAKLVPLNEAKEALAKLKLGFYASTENFPQYEKAALDYYGEGDGFSPQELGAVAFVFAEKSTDPAALKKALIWAEKAIMSNESFETAFILAKLYLKTGNKTSAKMYAQQALDLAKKSGADVLPIENLLAEIKK